MRSPQKQLLLLLAFLLAVFIVASGCKGDNKAGDTVPSPPRELIEKSYRSGNMGGPPPPQPGATKPQ